ncbi:MAG: RNA polymerase subunit sigma-70, partial [Oscillospiraceae bacterium]|nr:RNA polymerase subunit sigma-70 [Oscillospiraceae bacterium]
LGKSISGFLATLKEEQRSMFVRRYWFFDPISDIAKRYGYSESKVKSTLFRTREKLKTHLEKEGYSL